MKKYTLNDINPFILLCGLMNGATCPEPNTHFGLRCVKWFEIELILWGEGYILTNGIPLETRKDTIFFRTPGMMVDGVTPYHSYMIIFDVVTNNIRIPEYNNPNILSLSLSDNDYEEVPFIKSVIGLELPNTMKISNSERYRELFEKMHTIFLLHERNNQFLLKSLLLQILITAIEEWSYISKKNSSNRSTRNNFSKIMKVKEYILQNTKANMNITQLAAMADLSTSFFCKIFKKIMGVSPITYINTNKINLAKQLLTKTDMSIKEISFACGFENETYFFTLFKSRQGISPLNYKEKYGTQNLFIKR